MMQLRQLYEQFLHLPVGLAAGKYEAALQLWERHTSNPVAADLTAAAVESFRLRCAGAGIVDSRFHGCWRYLHSILKTASDNGVVVPYVSLRE